jgi:sensor histidine kinase YesM
MPAHSNTYIHSPWKAISWTTLFSVSVALLLWVLEFASPLWASLTVSLCIGWSIALSFIFLGRPFERWLATYIAPIPLVLAGLLTGLVIAGSLLFRQPLYFVTEDYYSLLLGVFFGTVGFAVFGVRGRLMQARAEIAQANAEREAQEKLLLETDLKLLQAQIEPHFLFNTLSNVLGLIHKDPDAAEETLVNLTTLLRASLKRTRQASTTLAEELEIIRAYLDIQSIRMQDRLRYTLDADPASNDFEVPPLLIQPVVENAVKHGIDGIERGGTITLTTTRTGEGLTVTVADTGAGIDQEGTSNGSGSGSGTGLSNVRSRLRTLYGPAATMSIQDNEPSGVLVTIKLPQADR